MDSDVESLKNANPSADSTAMNLPDNFASLPDSDPFRSLSEMLRLLKTNWSQSVVGKKTTSFFHRKIMTHQDINITEAMCLGIGGGFMFRCQDHRERALGLLAAFFWGNVQCHGSWVAPEHSPHVHEERFRSINGFYILRFASLTFTPETRFNISKIYFQDPDFKAMDVEFLRKLGFTVIWEDAAHYYTKETTFLFAPRSHFRSINPLLAHAQPALFIGIDHHGYCHKECLAKSPETRYSFHQAPVRTFFESRAGFKLPFKKGEGGWEHWLRGMKAYCEAAEDEFLDEAVVKFYMEVGNVGDDDLQISDDRKSYKPSPLEIQSDHNSDEDVANPDATGDVTIQKDSSKSPDEQGDIVMSNSADKADSPEGSGKSDATAKPAKPAKHVRLKDIIYPPPPPPESPWMYDEISEVRKRLNHAEASLQMGSGSEGGEESDS